MATTKIQCDGGRYGACRREATVTIPASWHRALITDVHFCRQHEREFLRPAAGFHNCEPRA
jgi:hypothetical protein